MNFPSKSRKLGSLLCIGVFIISGCGSNSQKNEAIRASNCALIADWNVYTNDPSTPYSQGALNTYQTEGEMEDRLWLKVQKGDNSYEALMELRKLRYSENLWDAPPIGEKVSPDNVDTFRVKGYEGNYDDDASWKIIDDVRASCPTFPKDYLANMFAPSLNY